MPEDKPELEKAEQRIMEVNEWFTPYTDYDALPYDTLPGGKPYRGFPDTQRSKELYFQLANVGRFKVELNYYQDLVDEAVDFETYLLVLPASEKIINGLELKKEQKMMETRPMYLELDFLDKALQGQTLPYNLEAELPSGQIISAELKPIGEDDELTNRPQTKEHWAINNQGFDDPQIPEVANIIWKDPTSFRAERINLL